MNKRIKLAIVGAVLALGVGGGSLAAVAATSQPVLTANKLCYNAERSVVAASNICPPKYKTFVGSTGPRGKTGATGATGPRGATGKAGAQGIQGVQGVPGKDGKSAVVWNGTTDVANNTQTPAVVKTGGPFLANATLIGTATLASDGTWMVQVNAKATPNASGDTVDIYPQIFVYTQPVDSTFSGNWFNVGSAHLEPDGTNHDSYYYGADTRELNGGSKLYFYAFGYDSDKGAGSYVLDYLHVTFTELSQG